MASIRKNIRFYQPNDPYYWEVDNLPITDLLSNDITLENRLIHLENSLSGLGEAPQGTFSTGAITDLKAYAEALSGLDSNFGKIHVRPGKFVARVQMPATRESGWRMARDGVNYFNNEDFKGNGGLGSTVTGTNFVRETQGVARTAIIEFYSEPGGAAKTIDIPSFNDADFNSESPPAERLDLIYIKGSKSLDTDGDSPTTPAGYSQDSIPAASLGLIKGAYFRTDSAAGNRGNGPRFVNPPSWRDGRTTGMATGEIPANTTLAGFGTVPMPEDLINLAWHRNYDDATQEASNKTLTTQQVEKEAAFSVPVAYVRVPRGFIMGDPIPQENVIDIRPFFRTAELTYSERASIAAAVDPHGNNPIITQIHLERKWLNPLTQSVSTLQDQVKALQAWQEVQDVHLAKHDDEISQLQYDVDGPRTSGEDLAARVLALELSAIKGSGKVKVGVPQHVYFGTPQKVYAGVTGPGMPGVLGTKANKKSWNLGLVLNYKIIAVMFRAAAWHANGGRDLRAGYNPPTIYIEAPGAKPVGQSPRAMSTWGGTVTNGNMDKNAGSYHSFTMPVQQTLNGQCKISTWSDVSSVQPDYAGVHELFVDGYIYERVYSV